MDLSLATEVEKGLKLAEVPETERLAFVARAEAAAKATGDREVLQAITAWRLAGQVKDAATVAHIDRHQLLEQRSVAARAVMDTNLSMKTRLLAKSARDKADVALGLRDAKARQLAARKTTAEGSELE